MASTCRATTPSARPIPAPASDAKTTNINSQSPRRQISRMSSSFRHCEHGRAVYIWSQSKALEPSEAHRECRPEFALTAFDAELQPEAVEAEHGAVAAISRRAATYAAAVVGEPHEQRRSHDPTASVVPSHTNSQTGK